MTEPGEKSADDSFKPKLDPNEDYGYYFFPERKGSKPEGLWYKLAEGRSSARTLNCIKNVNKCLQTNPLVKLLARALKSHGCDFTPERHVACEDCISRVNGGYDPVHNQVVVCKNNSQSEDVCCSVLSHEMIHMFDFCRAKADFTNLEHLACTEDSRNQQLSQRKVNHYKYSVIGQLCAQTCAPTGDIRAASIMHCPLMSAFNEGDASLFNFRQRHQECVKKKAVMSIMLVRNVKEPEARQIVDRVFTRCYADREPFGRIPRRGASRDPDLMLSEGELYGYTD